MRFLQWNIWYNEDIKNIRETIESLDVDVACLQEVFVNEADNRAQYLKDQLGFNSYFAEIQWIEDAGYYIGNQILSRQSLRNGQTIELRPFEDGGGYMKERRVIAEAILESGGGDISIATTHLSYNDAFQADGERVRELAALEEWLAKRTLPTIFSGDFNAVPDSHTVQLVSRYLANCGPSSNVPTWTTKPFEYNGFSADELNWRLDYVFATTGLTVSKSQIVETQYSDHLPILVEFDL